METIGSLHRHIVMRNIPFEIEEVRVLRELRIPKIKSLSELPEKEIAKNIKKAIDLGYALIEAKAVYRTFKLVKPEGEPPGIEESPGLFFGKKIAKDLGACDWVTLLLATIGPALPDRADELKNDEASDSFFLENVGGWMADYLAEKVNERITLEAAKNGYETGFRYAPGYGDWTLDAQPEMLRLLESEKLGVKLTDTKIMIPRKSVSAAIGWKPKG
ncbi:MAG: vitamin B12 dependent-methionine synthase activation domain-containing protein [Nitrospinota bacterium]